ncbi:hypothetical protein ACLSZP_09610 [Avibacterium avium]|uniref:hypothetical protein n=1 Tax=Avibacterium avium TaxID=751 RepID=UPI003BF91D27
MTKVKPIIRQCPKCGERYEYRRASGRTFSECELCRQNDCVICGKKVPLARGRKNTCCAACESLKIKNIQNVFYSKRIASDPELNKRNHQARKERRLADPEIMEKYKQKENERHKKRTQDPVYRQKRSEYQKQRYENNRSEILKKRADFWDGLSDEEKIIRKEKHKEAARISKRKFRDKLQQNPEKLAEYQSYQRKKRKEHRAREALSELMKQTQELINVADNTGK